MVCPAQTVHLSCIKISTIYLASRLALSRNGPNRAPLDPHHLGVPSGASKTIMSLWYFWHKLSTYLAPTLTLCQNRLKWDSTRPTSPRSSIGCLQYYFQAYGTFDANRAPILHQEKHYLQTDRTELALEPCHLGVPSIVSKTISIPTVCSVQTVHLSCSNTNTVSKRTKTRFHTTHLTYGFHRVCPKLFMSLWSVQCKPCTYLAWRLALSPNGLNRAPPDPRHLGVPQGASKMI
jgi:hypothetical protein